MPISSPSLCGGLDGGAGRPGRIALPATLCLALLLSGCGRSATQYIARGNQFFESGKYEEAVLNYRNAIKKDPKSGEAYYRLALALFRTRKTADGYQSLAHA